MLNKHDFFYANITDRRKRGFTIIEIVVVIGMVAILAMIITPNITAYREKANSAKIKADLRGVYNAGMSEYALTPGLKMAELRDPSSEKTIAFHKGVENLANISGTEFSNYEFGQDAGCNLLIVYTDRNGEKYAFNGKNHFLGKSKIPQFADICDKTASVGGSEDDYKDEIVVSEISSALLYTAGFDKGNGIFESISSFKIISEGRAIYLYQFPLDNPLSRDNPYSQFIGVSVITFGENDRELYSWIKYLTPYYQNGHFELSMDREMMITSAHEFYLDIEPVLVQDTVSWVVILDHPIVKMYSESAPM